MILYFSGTGNSKYVAKRLSEITNENILSINEHIKNNRIYFAAENERLIFVTPTYAWRIPRVVESWIKGIQQNGRHKAYFIMTCGGEIGNAERYLELLCRAAGMDFFGCAEVVMPENYIAMFSAPTQEEALQIIEKSEVVIDSAAAAIHCSKRLEPSAVSFTGKVYSGVVNRLFYPLFVHAKKFYAKDTCIGCGICEKLCPLNNISLKDGRPIWQDNCTHCMACICHCPVSAIEYGKKSLNQPRYTCPK